MNAKSSLSVSSPVNIQFHSIRNITAPEDLNCGRKVHVGQAPLRSILGLSTDENVRDYLLESEGRKRKVPTQVHRAIRDTLENNPQNFSVLNGGIVIVARDCEIDEKSKTLILQRPSIINGSQTQGVIKDFVKSVDEPSKDELLNYHVKFELIVTSDEDLIADISIARNFQNDVMTISIAGRLGQLNELEKRFQDDRPGIKLQKSETKLSEDYIKTERLLQVITALVPKSLIVKPGDHNKVYAYNMKTKCLKEFQEIYKKAKDTTDKDHGKYLNLYNFYLDIAAEAWELYVKWKAHPGFEGSRLRSIERENGKIREVPDGIIFPILAALSVFAKIIDGKWTIQSPESFSDDELIRAAKSVYIEIANSVPNVMGRSRACYSALYQITDIYQRLSKD